MPSHDTGCSTCSALIGVIQDLAARLDSTKSDLSAEREITKQLKCLNKYLLAESASPAPTIKEGCQSRSEEGRRSYTVTQPPHDTLHTTDAQDPISKIEITDESAPSTIVPPPQIMQDGVPDQTVKVGDVETEPASQETAPAVKELVPSIHAFNLSTQPAAISESSGPCSIGYLHGRAQVLYRLACRLGVINLPNSYALITRRTVLLTGIPPGVPLYTLLSHVCGGQLVSATLSDTITLTGSNTARLVFLEEAGAIAFTTHAARSPFLTSTCAIHVRSDVQSPDSPTVFHQVQIKVQHQQAFTHPLDQFVAEAIYTRSASRILRLSNLPIGATDPILLQGLLSPPGTLHHGIIYIEPCNDSTVSTRAQNESPNLNDKSVIVHFGSVIDALRAQKHISLRLRRHFLFRECGMEFLADPCQGRGKLEDGEQHQCADDRGGDDKSVVSRADSGIGGLEEGEVSEEWLIEL